MASTSLRSDSSTKVWTSAYLRLLFVQLLVVLVALVVMSVVAFVLVLLFAVTNSAFWCTAAVVVLALTFASASRWIFGS